MIFTAKINAYRSIKAGVSGRYSIIPPVGISVLQEPYSNILFSYDLVRNLFSYERVALLPAPTSCARSVFPPYKHLATAFS